MKSLKNLIYLCSGFLQYFSSRRNSEKSYHAYVKLHSITNGFSTYSFNIIYRIIDNLNFNKKKPFKNDKFIFNRENHFNLNDKADEIIKKINSDSYCELDSKISDEKCDKIVKYISSIKGYANKNENKPVNINDRNNDVSYINFHEKDLIKCDDKKHSKKKKVVRDVESFECDIQSPHSYHSLHDRERHVKKKKHVKKL